MRIADGTVKPSLNMFFATRSIKEYVCYVAAMVHIMNQERKMNRMKPLCPISLYFEEGEQNV